MPVAGHCLRIMFKLFREKPGQRAADSVYAAIVAQARHPEFYRTLGVPDTLDGRFDLLVIHAFLFFHRLKGEGEAARSHGQLVFDAMFADMDQNLREMGVGDMSIGKKVRKMGSAFYGGTEAYDKGVDSYSADPAVLEEAVRRNVFSEDEAGAKAGQLARYMITCTEMLQGQETDLLLSGQVEFPPAVFDAAD